MKVQVLAHQVWEALRSAFLTRPGALASAGPWSTAGRVWLP